MGGGGGARAATPPPPPNFSNSHFRAKKTCSIRAKPLDFRASNGESIRATDLIPLNETGPVRLDVNCLFLESGQEDPVAEHSHYDMYCMKPHGQRSESLKPRPFSSYSCEASRPRRQSVQLYPGLSWKIAAWRMRCPYTYVK